MSVLICRGGRVIQSWRCNRVRRRYGQTVAVAFATLYSLLIGWKPSRGLGLPTIHCVLFVHSILRVILSLQHCFPIHRLMCFRMTIAAVFLFSRFFLLFALFSRQFFFCSSFSILFHLFISSSRCLHLEHKHAHTHTLTHTWTSHNHSRASPHTEASSHVRTQGKN